MNTLNECPECGTRDTDRQMVEWHTRRVEVIHSCYDCELDFVVSLGDPVKEVVQRYGGDGA